MKSDEAIQTIREKMAKDIFDSCMSHALRFYPDDEYAYHGKVKVINKILAALDSLAVKSNQQEDIREEIMGKPGSMIHKAMAAQYAERAYQRGYKACQTGINMNVEDYLAETGWLIEASEGQKAVFVKCGYFDDYAPAWWTGVSEQIAMKHNPSWTHDSLEAVRFARKVDAEKVILGWGYSLENPWVFVTEHRWG